MSKKRLFLSLAASALLLSGCSALHQDVTELDPMVPATAEPVVTSANPLVKDMDVPAPETQQQTETSLWQSLRDGFALKPVTNSRITHQRDWYAKHPGYFHLVANRAKRYLYYIVQEAKQRKMPLELALLPVVESAFDPFAYSSSRASGLWQFIPSTGRYFNLTQDWWFDARRDIPKSTNAALAYLQKLANRFDGNWLLALASYNAGAGTVLNAIERNERRGLPTDFWHLDLPRETTMYVPKLLAVVEIIANPKKYGVTLPDIPNAPYFSIVKTGGQLDLSRAAKMAGVSVEELYMLNPGFNRWATPPNGPDRLLVPLKHEKQLKTALAGLPDDERVQWAQYTVKPGDSLLRIAHSQQVPVKTLKQINHLTGNIIIVGDTLLIPLNGNQHDKYAHALRKVLTDHDQPGGNRVVSYRVQSGDSLWEIANRYNVSVRDLQAWNGLRHGSVLHIGDTLKLYVAGARPHASAYTVQSGDSLWEIANRYQVSVAKLRQWNHLAKGALLHPGQTLSLYRSGKPAVSRHTALTHYTVKSGDSLWEIAHDNQVSVSQLRKWNHLSGSSVLQPGQTLLLASSTATPAKAAASNGSVSTTSYRVQAGDSLWDIAHEHNVTVAELRRWNKLGSSNTLQPGQLLSIGEKASQESASASVKKVHYSVEGGDSLYVIAGRFNVSVDDLQRWNNITQNSYIHPGQDLTLYVPN